jgi:hypothetical protein
MIDDSLNASRRKWAQASFYYGNNPPPSEIGKMGRNIERNMWVAWLAQNRNFLLGLDMEEKNRAKGWFQSLVQYMFDLGVPGTMSVLTNSGPGRDDAIEAMLNRLKTNPDGTLVHPDGSLPRNLEPIEHWVRRRPSAA